MITFLTTSNSDSDAKHHQSGRRMTARLRVLSRHLQPAEAASLLSHELIKVDPAVADALARGGAVVALESTIISHGAGSISEPRAVLRLLVRVTPQSKYMYNGCRNAVSAERADRTRGRSNCPS